MIDLYFFDSAKMAVVFFILMLSSATMEAQRNENDKFFDLMTAIGEDFGGEFNEAEKALELDLNGANSFLERLHTFATREIVRKNEIGEFECKESKTDFIKAIKAILGQNMRNLLGAIIVPKQSKTMINKVHAIKTIFDDKSFKKVEDFLNALIVPKKSDQIPSGSDDSVKFYSEKQLFNLLFSFAARLEALVHGKNIDGTLKEKEKNSKDKIQTFLAVPKCFIVPESELSIYDYWIEIIEMKTKKNQKPIYGVAIYKEKSGKDKSEYSKKKAFKLSRENYKILKQLNDQKFSMYESLNLLRAAFNKAYATINHGDEETNREYAAKFSKQKHILSGKIPQIFDNLLNQIESVFYFNWERNEYWDKNYKCEYAMFFQNISESFMKMMSDKGIDPELHLDSQDKEIRQEVQNDIEESCKKFENKEAKIIFLNNVHYELAINFEFNQRKDIHDRVKGLLSNWVGNYCTYYNLYKIEHPYFKENALKMFKIVDFISNTNRESISIIDALIGKEHFNQFNLVSLFDQMKTLVEETNAKEEANLRKVKQEINTKQLENDIKFLKNNPKSIAEEKYQKTVAIICTIKKYGENIEILTSKIKTTKIQKQLIKLSSKIQNNEKKCFGIELLKQMKESCNQLKPKQIQMEQIVFEEELLADLQFEFNKIWKSGLQVWEGMEEYYLSMPLMQLKEQARNLAKTFGKMLENVMEHYAQKMDASNARIFG